MKVMTFNLRFDNEEDGKNAWQHRRKFVLDLIMRHHPSILGTQEGKLTQLVYLKDHLRSYSICVPSERILDETSQYPTLFYRKDEFELQEAGEFWLSKCPGIHLSKDWDSAFPRMMSYALLVEKQSGQRFWALVTHLDHIGIKARREQAKIISRWVSEREEALIAMGDFNDIPGSVVHRILTSTETGLQDTWQLLDREENEESITHHNFSGVPIKYRIDWILINGWFCVKNASVIRDHYRNRYPSDHFPYEVELEWA